MDEIIDSKKLTDKDYALRDLISGDESVAESKIYRDTDALDVKVVLKNIINDKYLSEKTKSDLLLNSWKIIYRVKPPTIEEFLTPEWLGDSANSLYPHIRKWLTEFWNPQSGKRHLIMSPGIRVGKSTASAISGLFSSTNLWCMRNPKKFFNLMKMSSIVFMMISFTMDKAKQVLFKPFMEILTSSPKFKRVKFEERLEQAQKDNPDRVCWTTAGLMGSLQIYGDIHFILASDPAQLLGLNVIQAILSEISFFVDKGFSTDYIWRIYQDSVARVYGTFKNAYLSGTILDSSPNDIELSPIDKYVFSGEASKDPLNYVTMGPQWEFRPELNPIWMKTGETFPVFRGNAGEPGKILDEDEVSKYNSEEIYNVPIDQYKLFKNNCLKNIKDICGYPAGAAGMLIRDESLFDIMFVDNLPNIYTYIQAPEDMNPKRLIWNTIFQKFFIKCEKGYEFHRSPYEKRYIHVDQSESGDVCGISMVHPELHSTKGCIMIIVDFTIPISPEKTRINLDAVRYFIQDLVELGRLKLGKVTYDKYESSGTIQYLNRHNINSAKLSVDRTTDPYYMFISYMSSGLIRCGKNILLKNNLKSIHETETKSGRKKIDHTIGKIIYEDGGDWVKSNMGKYAKDVSDSLVGAVWDCIQDFTGVPMYQWDDGLNDDKDLSKTRLNKKEKILKELEEKYGLILGD